MCKLGKKSYGSGYLAGMKLGDMPLVEYTRDRLHREVLRRFGPDTLPESYELTTTYTPGGQLEQQHLNHPQLNREYGYDEGGRLVRISGPQQTRAYRYSDSGRLTGVRTTRPGLDITLPYATDPAGNRLPDPEFYPESSSRVWGDNRITEDMQYLYCYDKYGRLTEKTDRIPEGVIRMNDERTHRYEYDSQHRLVHYVRTQHGETQAEGRYVYDPLGRRVGKRIWKRERSLAGYMALAKKAEVTWYGWEGDRLTTIQTAQSRIQTVYGPGSFTPLVRIETDAAEQAKAHHRSLAEKLEQEGSEDGQAVQLPAALRAMLDRLEGELRRNAVSEESRAWLAGCGLTPEQMAGQLEPHDEPERALHLYHCDQRGLPLALITPDNQVAWRAEYDEWGNLSGEENPAHLEQVIRLPGQQYDEESGLYYNRHRYYNPGQGRYITQDPIGLKGGLNPYTYPLNPVQLSDPLGLIVVFTGDEKIQKELKSAYETIKTSRYGKVMIDTLEKSQKTYTITKGDDNDAWYDHENNHNTIYVDPDYHPDVSVDLACNNNGKEKASTVALLAHEIGHAYWNNGNEDFIMQNSENPIRKTLGMCIRTEYYNVK
ncbi:type IV secretion protein Rhs [Salmonella enterica subsp. enterica serovar Weltevreden]|nr:type IV secretion protein Rhs [Salmonella enterica subsp. enterica serovar Weltevreden]